jgi:hypothetical protein
LGTRRPSLSKLSLSLVLRAAATILSVVFWGFPVSAQSQLPAIQLGAPASSTDSPSTTEDQQSASTQAPAPQSETTGKPDPQSAGPSSTSPVTTQSADDSQGQQTKRILGIVPNFTAVSAGTHLPPLSVRQKFWLATEGTFDYSSFISVGIQAGIEQATNTYPEFHRGGAAFGRYYWHSFADAGVGNYISGAILPAITHEDPRYYTLGRGGFFHRTCYAMSRLLITKTDAGASTFNFSEVLGGGIATEVSSFYYPREERGGAAEILGRWASQMLNDAAGNVFQEFWPDINHKLFHRHELPQQEH